MGEPGSIPEQSEDGRIYNSSPTFAPDGALVALHRKVHLFDIDIPGGITFKESETLTGGDRLTIVETGALLSKGVPVERRLTCVFSDFGKIGIAICYDLRFPEIAMIAARKGMFLSLLLSFPRVLIPRFAGCIAMVYPAAFNTTTGPLHWDLLQRARCAMA